MALSLRRWAILNLLCLLLIPIFSSAQEISEIIRLHRDNLQNLYASRGAPPEWVTEGNVSESDIAEKIGLYRKKVGVVIYTMIHDSLNVTLLTSSGKTYSKNTSITADSLVKTIKRVNKYFALPGQANISRGVIVETSGQTRGEIQKTIALVSDLLLPDKEMISGWNHLVVVPTLNIASVPFYALKLSDTLSLVDRMSYSIAPSLYEIMVSQQINRDRMEAAGNEGGYDFNRSLIVANPDFSGGIGPPLPQLPGTREEADRIRRKLGENHCLYLHGTEAIHERVISGICDYDLLYFATHGISDSENPLDSSYLALAHGEKLTARDIQNIRKDCRLNASLVMLSACQTGLGGSHAGGIIGLARAFQIAGASHVVTSLWNIDDHATSVLMDLFFDELKAGGELMPHEALRMAILEYRKTSSRDPYYWSPFSIFGLPF